MFVIIHYLCRIRRTSLALVYINTGPCHVTWFYCWSYTGISIQLTVSPSLFDISRKFLCVIMPTCRRIHGTSLGLVYINTGPSHVIWFYCCSYTRISNQHNISPLLFDTSWHFDVSYNPLLEQHIPHVIPFELYSHWTLSCHINLLLFLHRCK
jgi:hypothetical protein